MASVNKVIIIGHLGADPEVRHLENGSVVANFNVATTGKYKGKNGEPIEQTEWFRVEVWDSLAGVAEKYLKTGNLCICYMGDGAVRQGAFHETLNMAM